MSRSARRDERGSAALEFGLIAVPLLWLVLGIVQYGFYFWSLAGANDAVRNAARATAVGSIPQCAGTGGFVAAVRSGIAGLTPADALPQSTVQRTFTGAAGAVRPGDVATITVRYRTFDLNIPAVPLPNGGQVTTSVQVRVENVRTQPQVCS